MREELMEVLEALYQLEERRLARGDFEGWCSPEEIAGTLRPDHVHAGDALWARRCLEQLWSQRKVLQIPTEAPAGSASHELRDVELRGRDAFAGSVSCLPVDGQDCRGPNPDSRERVAVYDAGVRTSYRSRVAEIARLLSRNYARMTMSPTTGLLRYEARPQWRPLYEVRIEALMRDWHSDVLAGKLVTERGGPKVAEFWLDAGIDRARLVRAIEAVLTALAQLFRDTGRPECLARFQVSSILRILAGLYCSDYRRETDAHIITAGVGSGKSFAFQVGALIHTAYKALAGQRSIQVLMLYPRVMLAANQFQDLFKLVERVSRALGVPLDGPVPDAGGQLVAGRSGSTTGRGELFSAIQEAYRGTRQIVISNLDTLANRLIHPEAVEGLVRDLDLVVLDEVHVLSGLYGAHAKMVLARLQLARAMWRLRRTKPACQFEDLLDRRGDDGDPYVVAASATISEPRAHLARILVRPPARIGHVRADDMLETGWVHHLFLKQRPEASSMTAAVNAVSCLVHNRRDGLVHEYYQLREDGGLVSLDGLSNPIQPDPALEPRDVRQIHKTLAFSDSLDGVNRWADLIADNERSKAASMLQQAGVTLGSVPYFVRFHEPLWRTVHHMTFEQDPPKWQQAAWKHYGALCQDCKQGVQSRITREPPGLNQAGRRKIRELWDFTEQNDSSYLQRMGVPPDRVGAETFAPVRDAGTESHIGNLHECGFFASGLCWWWSRDHLGNNHPAPASATEPLDGHKKPCENDEDRYHPVGAIRLRTLTSKDDTNFSAASIDAVFRGKASSIFRSKSFQESEENCSLLVGSPRIEVGIDLSRVADGLTFRAMRDPSSFQQKIGRVGRELASDSLLVHVVTENARDHFYFRNPRLALDPEYLQPIPLHENNRIVAQNHYFIAILDFLCLQGTGPNGGRIAGDGERLALVNDHKYNPSFTNWSAKVLAVNEFLFGNHPRQRRNLENLGRYLRLLGAQDSDVAQSAAMPGKGPADPPVTLGINVGAIDVFRHEFGPNFFLTSLQIPGVGPTSLANLCSSPEATPMVLGAPPRHEEFLLQLPRDEIRKSRSYLHDLLKLPVFRRGVPSRKLPGNQPHLWPPTFFEPAGKEYVRVFLEEHGRQKDLGFETVGMALALLSPGTISYRYPGNPMKVPVQKFGATGLTNVVSRVEAVHLDVDDAEYFERCLCRPLTQAELPVEFPSMAPTVPVFSPRQIGLIPADSKPAVTPTGLMADDDSRSRATPATVQLPTPPRCFALRWYRVVPSSPALQPPPVRMDRYVLGSSGASLPPPHLFGLFHSIGYDEALVVTEFIWGLDRQFASRGVEPSRLVYYDSKQTNSSPVALGSHFQTIGIRFELDLQAGSSFDEFFREVWRQNGSGAHQAILLHTLHAFLAEHARNPDPNLAPGQEKSRPSIFAVRDIEKLVLFHLLESWHPSGNPGRAPASPLVLTLDDIAGCFRPGHRNFISEARYRQLCAWVSVCQNPVNLDQRQRTLQATHANFQEASDAVSKLDKAYFHTTGTDVLLNTLGLAMHAAGLRLSGAQGSDLGYFFVKRDDGPAAIYLFDADELGNGTVNLIRDTMHVSAVEQILVSKQLGLGQDPDPLPTTDFVNCLEDVLQECPSSHASQLAFHDVQAVGPCLHGLSGARNGEARIAGRVFEFLRKGLGLTSIDHVLPFQACPEFLAHASQYTVHAALRLVPSPDYSTFQALESAMGFCIDGCIACVVAPEQNIKGVLSAKDTVSKLLLDAMYRTLVCESNSPWTGLVYPGTGPGRTETWARMAQIVASAVGKNIQTATPVQLSLPGRGGSIPVTVIPAAVVGGWDRVFRPSWAAAPVPAERVRPRMAF